MDPAYVSAKDRFQSSETPTNPVPKRRYGRAKDMLSVIGFGGIIVKDVTAEDAIAASQGVSKTDRADTFLKSFLAEGEQWEKEVMEAAETKGFTESQVRRARERLGVTSHKKGFGGWTWRLPEDGAARD